MMKKKKDNEDVHDEKWIKWRFKGEEKKDTITATMERTKVTSIKYL